jgi:hypothetical protein
MTFRQQGRRENKENCTPKCTMEDNLAFASLYSLLQTHDTRKPHTQSPSDVL